MIKLHISKFQTASPESLKLHNFLLYNNLYYKINDQGISKGCQRLYYFLDKIYGDDHDYSVLLKRAHSEYYWTDKRICKIVNDYIIANDDLSGFYKYYPTVMQVINKKHSERVNYYLKLLGYNPNDERFNFHKNGYWTWEKTLEIAQEIYNIYGNLSTHIWINAGYPETPLNKHKLEKIKEAINYKSCLRARDGRYYRSFREVFFANLLWFLGIEYFKEPDIPNQDNVPKINRCKCDFMLPLKSIETNGEIRIINVYVEIWGYNKNNKDYTKRKKDKIKFYKDNELILIEIPFELFNSNNSFEYIALEIISKLKKNGILINEDNFSTEDVLNGIVEDYDKMKKLLRERLIPYIHEKKYLPSEKELKNKNEYSLIIDIKHLGGLIKVAELLGLQPNSKMKKAYKGKWTDEKMIIELLNTLEENNLPYIPSLERLKKQYNPALGSHIRNIENYNLLIEKVHKKIYIPSYDEYIRNIDYNSVIQKLNELNNTYGYIPNKNYLCNILGLDSFYRKLLRYFNGYVNAAHHFNYNTEKEYNSLKILTVNY